MKNSIDLSNEDLNLYLKASEKLTRIAHGTNFSIDGCESPTKFVISDKSAPDFKVSIELDFDSNTPIKVSTDTASKNCENELDAQEYILRLVNTYRIKNVK